MTTYEPEFANTIFGVAIFGLVIVTPVIGAAVHVCVTPAVPVCVKLIALPVHIVGLFGVKAALGNVPTFIVIALVIGVLQVELIVTEYVVVVPGLTTMPVEDVEPLGVHKKEVLPQPPVIPVIEMVLEFVAQ